MSPLWKNFLQEHGARITGDGSFSFDDADREVARAAGGNIVTPLAGDGLIRVRGPEARDFLQNQLSNDIRQVDAGHAQLSAYCSPKGRILALFHILLRQDDYCLRLPCTLADAILQRLRMYVLRARVELERADEALGYLGISGPDAADLVKDILAEAPAEPYRVAGTRDVTVTRLPGPHARFLILAEAGRLDELWRHLRQEATPAGDAAWRWLDIMAGLPTVLPQTQEAFVPQMMNLELLGGVNFKKGCYPGQEIVARMQYLGRLKQRMYRLHLERDTPPPPGEPVFAPDLPGQAAGTVVDAQPGPEGGCDLLAVVRIRSAEGGELHLAAEDGPVLHRESLPYALPAQESA